MNKMELPIHKRRAVAPIIATLLMVAIAVVGGILIFVFAQGFFEDTQIVAPTIEQLTIFGYNATDRNGGLLTTHAGIEETVTDTTNNALGDGEEVFVFLRNSGGGELLISDVEVFGVALTANTGVAAFDAAPGEWSLSIDGTTNCACQLIGPGQEGTLIIGYDNTINGDVKVGRPMFVKIETGAGTTFTKQVIIGRDVG